MSKVQSSATKPFLTYQQQAIKALAEQREIPFLVHFTPIENLASILQHGLFSRDAALDPQAPEFDMHATDEFRLDQRTDAISLSIAHPNSRMFHVKRYKFNYQDWVVLLLSPRILWEKECAFFPCNAASSEARYISERTLRSAAGLENMFAEEQRQPILHSYDPTDEQAEVMVSNHIGTDYIQAVVFSNAGSQQLFQALLAAYQVESVLDSANLFNNRAYVRTIPSGLFA